jgi:4-alpha-glucanotransferase
LENRSQHHNMASERKREVGVLCHITSLPGGGPHGTLSAVPEFINKLAESGCSVWQMLPLTPPDEHASPYASSSAFAAWTDLAEETTFGHRVKSESGCKVEEFGIEWEKRESFWLDDWSLYFAIKRTQNHQPWSEWPTPLRDREPAAIAEEKLRLSDEINGEKNAQSSFMQSWASLRKLSTEKGVRLFGDLPFFIAHDSADVWANRDLFHLNGDGSPSLVAGVPPDYFSKKGQRWGTMLYNWDAHRATGFAWWKARMTRMFDLFDMVRIDHFRALEAAWAIPASDLTAEHGAWQDGPGDELLEELMKVVPETTSASTKKELLSNETNSNLMANNPELQISNPMTNPISNPISNRRSTSLESSSSLRGEGCGVLVAEDLGIIPPSVVAMRRRFGIPGMAVLQFGFDAEEQDAEFDGSEPSVSDNNVQRNDTENVVSGSDAENDEYGSDGITQNDVTQTSPPTTSAVTTLTEESTNPNYPELICHDQIAYTGTHDNDTTAGWWTSSPEARCRRVKNYVTSVSLTNLYSDVSSKPSTNTDSMTESSAVQSLIQMALNSAADLVIIPIQDIAALGSEARMNTPGTKAGNWRWRLGFNTLDDDDWIRFVNQIQEAGRG